jgi:hypothetical protein
VKVRAQQSPQLAQQGGAQQDQAPDSGPDQYGDQSIVNAKSGSAQSGKKQPKAGKTGGGS